MSCRRLRRRICGDGALVPNQEGMNVRMNLRMRERGVYGRGEAGRMMVMAAFAKYIVSSPGVLCIRSFHGRELVVFLLSAQLLLP